MAHLKIDLGAKLVDGMDVKFKAPCDCTEVTGLLVVYLSDTGAVAEKSFTFRDCHGNNLAGVSNIFAAGAYVTAVLDTSRGYAFVQNADTNAYLEAKKAPALKTPRKIGAASFDGSKDISLRDIGAAELDAYGKVMAAQAASNMVSFKASATLAASHCGCFLSNNGASGAVTLTIPNDDNNTIFPIGTEIEFCRFAAGEMTIKASDNVYLRGVSLNNSGGIGYSAKINNRYAVVVLKKITNWTWLVVGDAS